MQKDIIHTENNGERVTSTYAGIYFDDSCCNFKKPLGEHQIRIKHEDSKEGLLDNDNWKSPSDLLIGILDLKPPFTSKITRGKTHQGILAIGNGVVENERFRFLKELTNLIRENDSAWSCILDLERKKIETKIKKIYDEIFQAKSKTMTTEIANFYETTLQELEDHIRTEIQSVLISVHANIVSNLNFQIKEKLEQEKEKLEKVLKTRYLSEIKKVKQYYKILLNNELDRNNKLINQALLERNEAFSAFLRKSEAENITSTMYVLCMERKKCKIRQFILDNYLTTEISEKHKKMKERQEIIEEYKKRDVGVSQINKGWEEKIKKVLQLFLKFISFSLKLLPEQSTFLLDLEKMVVLQLNEMQKMPEKVQHILVVEDNFFKFDNTESKVYVCDEEPFVIVGDLSDTPPRIFGSRETIPSDVDLPLIRLQRQFVYAKCNKYEEIKAILESQRCKCLDKPMEPKPVGKKPIKSKELSPSFSKESSNESLLIDDIKRFEECPVRNCKDWAKRFSFPYLNDYLDYTEENFERLKVIIGKPPNKDITPGLIDPKEVVFRELPYSATKEKYHHIGTQYSSQEDLEISDMVCLCTSDGPKTTIATHKSLEKTDEDSNKLVSDVIMKRVLSLRRLLQEHPNMLKMFTDESFDFQL